MHGLDIFGSKELEKDFQMCSDKIAIRVQQLSKCYQIYQHPRDRLKQFVFPTLQRIIRLTQRKYYQEFWALHNISFEINKGETVGIVGHNGSGKSSLLQIICGTLALTSGAVETNGRIAALLELGSGFNPEFTGSENVYMNAAILGLSDKEIRNRFDSIAAFADIGDFIEQPVKTYSSGMMMRLAFAVAINVDPQILIVDEALSVGDELFQRKCYSRIEAIREKGATILFVSHSGSAIIELCDRAILLDGGEMLAIGAPKYIIGKYQKLLYAPKENRAQIREEILQNDHTDLRGPHHVSDEIIGNLESMEEENKGHNEFYDPNLCPQSTISYESFGVYIESPEILTLFGDKVNYLNRGTKYRYRYKVKFEKDAYNVRFGMLIKTITGMELGGYASASSPGKGIPMVDQNSIIEVEFEFMCNLNPGDYFLNAGVTGTDNEEEKYLHRILDFYMFRVFPIPENNTTAIVDFQCKSSIRHNNFKANKNITSKIITH